MSKQDQAALAKLLKGKEKAIIEYLSRDLTIEQRKMVNLRGELYKLLMSTLVERELNCDAFARAKGVCGVCLSVVKADCNTHDHIFEHEASQINRRWIGEPDVSKQQMQVLLEVLAKDNGHTRVQKGEDYIRLPAINGTHRKYVTPVKKTLLLKQLEEEVAPLSVKKGLKRKGILKELLEQEVPICNLGEVC